MKHNPIQARFRKSLLIEMPKATPTRFGMTISDYHISTTTIFSAKTPELAFDKFKMLYLEATLNYLYADAWEDFSLIASWEGGYLKTSEMIEEAEAELDVKEAWEDLLAGRPANDDSALLLSSSKYEVSFFKVA